MPSAAARPKALPPDEDHRVHALHGVLGIEQIGLAGPGSGTPDVHPGNRPLPGQDHRAAGGEAVQLMVADLDAGNGNESGIVARRDDGLPTGLRRRPGKSDDDPESEEQQGRRQPVVKPA